MAQESGPFDEQNLAEDAYRDLASPWLGDGIIGDPGSSTLQLYADGSGMQVKLRTGRAQIQGFRYRNTAEIVITIPANSSGSVRIDRIVLRLDPTANSITPFRVAGTAGAGVPSITRTAGGSWDIYVAQVRVEVGAVNIAADKVTDERLYTGLRPLVVGTFADLARVDSPRLRQRATTQDSGLVYEYTGSAWVLTGESAAIALLRGLALSNPGFNNASAAPTAYSAGVSLGNMNGPNGFGPVLTFQWDGSYIQFFKDPSQPAMVRSGYGDGTSWGPWQTL